MKYKHSSSMNKRSSKCVRTADAIATLGGKFVLIERQKFPFGLALPGGHIDAGENSRQTAIREFTEETGLTLHDVHYITRRFGKNRDPRYQVSSTSVYAGKASGSIRDEEGFTKVTLLSKTEILKLPSTQFAFDHWNILMQFLLKS